MKNTESGKYITLSFMLEVEGDKLPDIKSIKPGSYYIIRDLKTKELHYVEAESGFLSPGLRMFGWDDSLKFPPERETEHPYEILMRVPSPKLFYGFALERLRDFLAAKV